MLKRLFISFAALPALASCATTGADAPVTVVEADAVVAAEPVSANASEPVWAFEESDIPVDPGYRFGVLDNGMRYIIRSNDTPKGQGLVRMVVETGSIDETEAEQGFAHFLEHMVFNGSTNVPEGEMIKLLERKGLAFGADTNASTGIDVTQYKLDLPNNSEDILDTALMLMRETASELTISQEAVDREKGVILAERRDRNSFSFKNTLDSLAFSYPDARFPTRLPIGQAETIEAATAEGLRAYWEREYVPAATTLIVVGDFDPDIVEAKIREGFSDWDRTGEANLTFAGPVDPDFAGATDIYLDPALPEMVTFERHGVYAERPDTIAQRKEDTLRGIAYGIIGRRMTRLAREENPPFRGAGFSTGDVLDAGRTTSLIVQTIDGQWQRGVDAAIAEYNRALAFGFTEAEVAEQIANRRTGLENAAANEGKRSNGALTGAAIALVTNGNVPSLPSDGLERFNAFADDITPDMVLAALRSDVIPLDNPNIRFIGKTAPEGGEQALRAAWDTAIARAPEPLEEAEVLAWPYTDFGTPGTVVSDEVGEALGIRRIRFANGVMLNLKRTDLADDQIYVQYNLDGGALLDTKDNPLATEIAPLLPQGGLGKLSADQLQTALAGRTVTNSFNTSSDTFFGYVRTTPRDLDLQLQLMAALLTDPGYRTDAVTRYQQGLDDYFARRYATPGAAYGAKIGEILSDGDPRFSFQPEDAYRALDFDKVRADISDRLANGAIEIGVVGDIDEQAVIDAVAATFGALPDREPEFRSYDDNRSRSFTDKRGIVRIEHKGEPDQAQVRFIWPTVDDSDFERDVQLSMLARVVDIALTDNLREELGQAYTPYAGSSTSRIYRDYGTFYAGANVDYALLDDARDAVIETINMLRDAPVDDDLIQRARQPVLEGYDNALKTNAGWMGLVEDAQRRPEGLRRYLAGKDAFMAVTGEQLQALAREFLDPDAAVQVLVVPKAED